MKLLSLVALGLAVCSPTLATDSAGCVPAALQLSETPLIVETSDADVDATFFLVGCSKELDSLNDLDTKRLVAAATDLMKTLRTALFTFTGQEARKYRRQYLVAPLNEGLGREVVQDVIVVGGFAEKRPKAHD